MQEVHCRQVTGNLPGANGLALWQDRMFVGDSKTGTVTVYHIDIDHGVSLEKEIVRLANCNSGASLTHHKELGAAADNINVIPSTGDMIVSSKSSGSDRLYKFNLHEFSLSRH